MLFLYFRLPKPRYSSISHTNDPNLRPHPDIIPHKQTVLWQLRLASLMISDSDDEKVKTNEISKTQSGSTSKFPDRFAKELGTRTGILFVEMSKYHLNLFHHIYRTRLPINPSYCNFLIPLYHLL